MPFGDSRGFHRAPSASRPASPHVQDVCQSPKVTCSKTLKEIIQFLNVNSNNVQRGPTIFPRAPVRNEVFRKARLPLTLLPFWRRVFQC